MGIATKSLTMSLSGGLTCLVIQHPKAHATIALQGAQILSYAPSGMKPVIWLSEKAAYLKGQPVRGGIPVCWPWFGDLQRNPDAVRAQFLSNQPPAHGWVRSVDWQVSSVGEDDEGVAVTLSVPKETLLQSPWSVAADLQLEICVGESLKLKLTSTATANGEKPIALSQALHTYLAISDISAVSVDGLEGVPFIDTLQDWQTYSEASPVIFTSEVDRIYQGDVGEVRLMDRGWQRALCLRASNSHSLVLWNPHIEKAKRLSQFAEDAWQCMLCIETSNVMGDIITLQPGQRHVLQLEITAEPLP